MLILVSRKYCVHQRNLYLLYTHVSKYTLTDQVKFAEIIQLYKNRDLARHYYTILNRLFEVLAFICLLCIEIAL